MTLPLRGTRILDLTRLLPGGICTMLLADLGADVIKVEAPDGGDYARSTPPLMVDGMGAYFHATNRNKRSITLDLKTSAGTAALHRLVKTADVLIESFRPGVMKRLGCDYDALKAIHPRLVYCAISGWGQTGAYAAVSGHDLNYVAMSGLIGEMGSAQPLGGQVADVGGAYTAAAGIMAALLRRTHTGEGGFIDVSLFESALPFVGYAWVEAVMQERVGDGVQRGILSGRYACYNIYRTQDRLPVALAALEPRFWANFCSAIERPDLTAYHVLPERQRYLLAELEAIFALHPAETWDAKLLAADCCYSRVQMPHELAADPHLRDRGALDVDPESAPYFRSPIRLSDTAHERGRAPGFGEHTIDVLRESGFSDDDIAALIGTDGGW
ncbi:MAG: CoA transferase [bacterium]|nr:CoA transferase [bacterium]